MNLNREEFSVKLRNVVGDLVGQALTGTDANGNRVKTAIKYLTPTMVIKATMYGNVYAKRAAHSVRVTMGSPNYAEREFIKAVKKAGEPFPVKKIQLKFARERGR